MPPIIDKPSWFKIDAGTVITLISWVVMGAFYVGVHKIELDNLSKQITQIQSSFKVSQEQVNANNIKITILERDSDENNKKIQELSRTVTKIETISIIIDNIKDTQKDMKDDLRDLKRLMEQKFTVARP